MMIREMKPSDVPQVAEIEAQCFSVPWSKQGFWDSIARDDTIFLVAVKPDFEQMDLKQEVADCVKTGSDETQSVVDEGRNTCLEKEDLILGYIGMYISFEEGEITNVAVSSKYRKHGIGNHLVTAMQRAAKEKNLERMILEVRATNEPALSLYKRKGFTELGIRKNFYEKPTEDAIIMSCAL